MSIRSTRRWRVAGGSLAVTTLVTVLGASATAAPQGGGYLTDNEAYITLAPGLPAGAAVTPIISSGETIGDFQFQGIPDGIGVRPGADPHTVDVYVVHEETTVPFFGTADFQNASASKLTLNTKAGAGRQGSVLDASVAIDPADGFLRFCSATMAGPAEGFDGYVYMTGEETNDAGLPGDVSDLYGPDVFPGNGTRQGGFAVALDTDTGDYVAVPGLGRLNHENTIAVPGYDELALLTTDDTFSRPSAQVYMYRAADQDALFADEGGLWAFRTTSKNGVAVDPSSPFNGANDYGDVQPGDELTGEFIPVPDDIAAGTTQALPQTALENWSNENNVFQFVRAEDIVYDVNDPHVIYMADTGGTGVVPDPNTGRLTRGAGGISDNGAIFRFELDGTDPTVVTSFTKIAQGDDAEAGAFVPFVSPDNLATSKKSLMVQEDTANARIWQYQLRQGAWRVVASVNDPDGESSGIVGVSDWFGGGRWLLDVQAHGTYVDSEQIGDVLYKLEDGQLMLLNIPGS
jgi:hypothetical protein